MPKPSNNGCMEVRGVDDRKGFAQKECIEKTKKPSPGKTRGKQASHSTYPLNKPITYYHRLSHRTHQHLNRAHTEAGYCIVSIHLYSASCSAHQSEALPVRETMREESSGYMYSVNW